MRSRIWVGSAWLALIVSFTGVSRAETKKDYKGPSFAEVVQRHFVHWDLDFDGKLTPKEVTAAVLSLKVTGDQAAAIAAVHVYLRGNPDVASVTKNFLLQPHPEGTAGRRDQAEKGIHLSANYASFRAHLLHAPRAVFANKESPSLAGFSQGRLGDCYFLASVIAAINADQPAFRGMFRPQSNGACEVTFHNGPRVHVRLTDAEIALSSSAGEQGVWLNVAEKAFGEVRQRMRQARQRPDGKLGLDEIAHGGYTPEAIEVFCGTRAKTLSLRKDGNRPRAEEAQRLKGELHGQLDSGLSRRFLFCCSTGEGSKYPPGIASGHSYAILGYDARAQVVTLMNPWGNHFEPKGAAGMDRGYTTVGGKFAMPLNDFVLTFTEVYFQTSLPPKRR